MTLNCNNFLPFFIRNQILSRPYFKISLWSSGCSRNPQPALAFFNIYIFISYSSPLFRHFIPMEQNLGLNFMKSLIGFFAVFFILQIDLLCINLGTKRKFKIQSGYGKIKSSKTKGKDVLGLIMA